MLAVLGDSACAQEIGTVLVYADEVQSKAMCLEEAVDKFQAGGGNVMAIKNRYYSANVTVMCLDVTSAAESGQMSGVDACVVVNPSDLSALSAVLADHDFGTRLMVRLLDGPEVEGEEGSEDESPSELLLWCLDHGFELVTADRSNLFVTWGEREKDGLARVVEALQPTMWTGMVKADPTTVAAGMHGGAVGRGGSATRPAALAGMESSSSTDDVDSAAAAAAAALAPASEASAASPLITQGSPDPLDFEELVKMGELSGEQGQEEKFDTVFTSFMDEARRVRAAAISGDVPDAVRRDQAAKIAAQMATFMGFDEHDDEDDSD